jgi:iron complex outermembrane recepter protein
MQKYSYPNALSNYQGAGVLPTTFLSSSNELLFDKISLAKLLALSPPKPTLASDYSVQERVWAAYVRADFAAFADRLAGNIGVRYVNTAQTSRGYAPDLGQLLFTQQGAQTLIPNVTPAVVHNDYHNWLPSLNAKLDINDHLVARLGLARVMTRPDLSQLSTSTSVSANVRTVTQFNPKLKPFLADQADLSLEYYFGKAGLVSAAIFYKNLNNFVVNSSRTQDLTLTLQEGGGKVTFPFTFFAPKNATGGEAEGV